MTTWEIEYILTGSGEKKKTDKVWISSSDEGVHNIIDAINYFERIAAENWKTYETKHAIVNIKTIES